MAKKAGFCYGVERAFNLALQNQKNSSKRIYTLGPLIHNKDAINYLKANNIYPIEESEIDSLNENDTVIIRSHGISYSVYLKLKEKNLNIVDATCPNVSHIHKIVKKYHDLNYQIIIIGDKNHPEVKGINGWCSNSAVIVKDNIEVNSLKNKVCVVSQTTEKIDTWNRILKVIKDNCEEVIEFNTICNATKERQRYAEELSRKATTMLVIGSKQSSNTRKLFELCKKNCKNTLYIENVKDIYKNYYNCIYKFGNVVGITAGASTPKWIIEEVINKMEKEVNNEQLDYMNANNIQIAVGDVLDGKIISVTPNEIYVNLGYKSDGVLPKDEIYLENKDIDLTTLYNSGDNIKAKVINLHNDDGFVVLSTVELEREKAYEEIKKAYECNTCLQATVNAVVNGGITAEYKSIRIFIPASHVNIHHIDDLKQYVGEKIDIKIIEYINSKRKTRIVGSHRKILEEQLKELQNKTWNSLTAGQVVEGEVKRITSFGAFVNVGGVDGLLHISELSCGRVNKVSDVVKIGDKIKVYVIDVDKENQKLSLSLKRLLEDPWNNVEKKYPLGNIVLGKIVRLTDFGAFVELEPGVDGLVYITEISYTRINKPQDVLKIGEMVKAKIINVNKEQKRISLSIKEVNNN